MGYFVRTSALHGFREEDDQLIPLKFDLSTNALTNIDFAHHEIHEGDAFTASYKAAVAQSANLDLLIVTPNTDKYVHLTYEFDCEKETELFIYEGVTATAAANPVVAYNRNRNSAKTATLVITHTPTGITEGTTIIRSMHIGSGKAVGGGDRTTHEFILKKNTKYLFRLTNMISNADNDMSVKLDWYEHTDEY